jgi:hypothetical protein
VTFNGMDGPVADKTPDFVMALDIDHARDGEVMLAYGMNGEDPPVLNGFPLRLVVPGDYGTLLGQAPQRDHRHRQRVRFLDEIRLPDTGYAQQQRRARHRAEVDDPDETLCRSGDGILSCGNIAKIHGDNSIVRPIHS